VSLTELFPAIKMLLRADKLRLMQFLAIDLAHEEGVPLLTIDAEYASLDAAACLQARAIDNG
jgi:hypothetical protein